MASSADSSDHETEADAKEKETSRFVVGADRLRKGEFATLDDALEEIDADDE